jgi:hypothetical protein
MPSSVVSDRDSRFLSKFWTAFCSLSGVKRDLSTSRHQQTDGGSDIVVGLLKTAFKGISTHQQTEWTEKLMEVQFSYSNSTHFATGFTPFYLAYALDPQSFPCFHDAAIQEPLLKEFARYERDLVRAHVSILKSQQRMENSNNRRHHAVEPFVVGTYALLSRSGLNWVF